MGVLVCCSTFFLPEGNTGVADAGAICGCHEDVMRLATDKAAQSAIRGGARAGEVLSSTNGCQGIADSISTGGPVDVSSPGAAE